MVLLEGRRLEIARQNITRAPDEIATQMTFKWLFGTLLK